MSWTQSQLKSQDYHHREIIPIEPATFTPVRWCYDNSPAGPNVREPPDLQPLQEKNRSFGPTSQQLLTENDKPSPFPQTYLSLSTLASESSSCSTFDTPKTYKWFYIFPRAEPITIAKTQTAFSEHFHNVTIVSSLTRRDSRQLVSATSQGMETISSSLMPRYHMARDPKLEAVETTESANVLITAHI
jgi:hypothetical protein